MSKLPQWSTPERRPSWRSRTARSFYKSQWERLFQHQAQLKQFIKGNESRLKVKKS